MAKLILDELLSLPFSLAGNAHSNVIHDFRGNIEAMLRAQNALGEGYLLLDEDEVVFLNAAFCRICGCEASEVTTLEDLLDRAESAARQRLARRFRDWRTGEPVSDHYETVFMHSSGRPIPVEIAAHGNSSHQGKQRILVIVRDISERRRREEECESALRESTQLVGELRRAARNQRRLLRDILSTATEGRLILCETPDELPEPAGETSEPMTLSAPGLARLRRRVEERARRAGFVTEAVWDIVSAASEAASNAVLHGNGGTAHLYADDAMGRLQVWVDDDGPGIALKDLHRAVLERGYTTAGSFGHGFSMILLLCDRVYLLPKRMGTTVVLCFERDTRRANDAKTGL
jgi:PAS domain S-box-containing protein